MRDMNRRSFLIHSCGTAAVLAGSNAFASIPEVAGSEDITGKMTWLNEPASWKHSGDQLIVRSRPKTDFWRKTFYDYVTDNGHFFHVTATGNFVFEARIHGQYSAQYDQAGLMVRIDAENWMKCGTEFFEGKRHASVVFTRDFSEGLPHIW